MLFWCVGVCVFVVVVVCFCWFVCLYVLLDPNVVGGGFFFFFFLKDIFCYYCRHYFYGNSLYA